jgi:hypothetical protein
MASVANVTSITGPAGPVFDLITSARFWPDWHPASRAVFGVTQRPYQLGDLIHERVLFAATEHIVTWRVAEHIRPSRVVLQAVASPTRITYTLEPRGTATEFRREVEYDEAQLRQALPQVGDWGRLVFAQSEEGLRRLKELIEDILREEQAAPPSAAHS